MVQKKSRASSAPKPYQSFPGRPGVSDSEKKFHRLNLPSLKSKSVLDLGCNEGFFCGKAAALGAGRVVGLDKNPAALAKARERFPAIEFLAQSWNRLPAEKFDIVLLISSLQYAADPGQLLEAIRRQVLAPDGCLILESGVIDIADKRWIRTHRQVGSVLYPTVSLLEQDLLHGYAFRRIGASVNQPGDPVNRFIYHCRQLRQTVIFIGGEPESGKSSLALKLPGVTGFSLDHHLLLLTRYAGGPMVEWLRKRYRAEDLAPVYRALARSRHVEAFARSVIESLPADPSVGLEGYGLSLRPLRQALEKQAEAAGLRIWHLQAPENMPPDRDGFWPAAELSLRS